MLLPLFWPELLAACLSACSSPLPLSAEVWLGEPGRLHGDVGGMLVPSQGCFKPGSCGVVTLDRCFPYKTIIITAGKGWRED